MGGKKSAYRQGLLDGIVRSGWTCGDCGNTYDATVDSCPNRLLDLAIVEAHRRTGHPVEQPTVATGTAGPDTDTSGDSGPGTVYEYLEPERNEDGHHVVIGPYETRAQAEQAAEGRTVVPMSVNTDDDSTLTAGADHGHFPECPNAHGSCCPWMGDCTCQCLCDLIGRVQQRVTGDA